MKAAIYTANGPAQHQNKVSGKDKYMCNTHLSSMVLSVVSLLDGAPNSANMDSLCSPTRGTGPILGLNSDGIPGGNSICIGPTGDSTSVQRLRARSCGWFQTPRMSFTLALAMPALSSSQTA